MSARVASRVISRAPARRTTPRFRVVRNVVQRVTRPVVKRAASSGFDISDCVEDISKTVSSSVGNPLFLLSSLAVFALVVTHQTAFTSGVIGKWAKDNSENVFAKWLLENSGKFLGLAVFLPSILTSPKKKQVVLGILVFLWVTLIPESSVYQYCIQSAAIHCYFRVKNSNTRLLLVIAIAIAYACGWLSVAGDLSPASSQAAKATIPRAQPSSG